MERTDRMRESERERVPKIDFVEGHKRRMLPPFLLSSFDCFVICAPDGKKERTEVTALRHLKPNIRKHTERLREK